MPVRASGLVCCATLALMVHAGEPATPGVVVERDVAVPMRDGVTLRADVHRPEAAGEYPVLVMRTPYDKTLQRFDRHVRAGYIVVCQDVRGRHASEGTWESFLRPQTHEAEDGFDTVQWAADMPGSNGKVGTIGTSYCAWLQWKLAALRPPALVAMSAHSIAARYTDIEGPGTIRPGRRLKWWAVTMSPDMRRRADRPGTHTEPEASAAWDAGRGASLLNFLPWIDLPRDVCEDETPFMQAWLRNPADDPWKLDELCREIAVPNLEVVGWYDHAKGDMRLQQTLCKEAKTAAARDGSRMVIGPWSHYPPGGRKFGAIDFGPEADLDLVALEIRWFDFWLQGKANGVDRDKPVRIFVMGDDRWREEDAWPPPRARAQSFYLGGGRANTPAGGGTLTETTADVDGSDRYRYDPRDPVPTVFGPGMFTSVADQRPLATRQDILVYQTEPLERRFEATGIPSVELYAASSAPDTDWMVRLIDVGPDGLARDVSMGVVRARYRDGLDKPQLIEPGTVIKYTIRMNPTSNAFLPGHRIRLDVTSSDFPNYDRNHNTAADQNADATLVTAEQTVYHGTSRPSRLVLPEIGGP